MKSLEEIQMLCTASMRPEDVHEWLAEQGIDGVELLAYASRFSQVALTLATETSVENIVMGAFGCGFEMGIRWEQNKEIEI